VNTEHDEFCASAEWAAHLAAEVIPWGLADLKIGPRVLELGPGFGASTAYLIEYAEELIVVESDPALATDLASRFASVEVHHADAAALPLPSASVDSVVCFTMLHHVSPPAAQDDLFAEAARVVRPGGWFAGTDSLASEDLRDFHANDTYEPVDPLTMRARLQAAGFRDVKTDFGDRKFRFRARRRTRPSLR
jgi:SAM-dependent methyltransferase